MKTPTVRPIAELWEWQTSAACRGLDSAKFFSPTGERGQARMEREAAAREICRGCVVREECARFAAESGEQHGVWGGVARDRDVRIRRSGRTTAVRHQSSDKGGRPEINPAA